MKKTERTHAYIDAMGKYLIDLLKSGHMLFDEGGFEICAVEQKGFGDAWGLRYYGKDGGAWYVSYHDDPNSDNGYYDSVTTFKKKFSRWTTIDPKHIKKLKLP